MRQIILASISKRRKQVFELLGIKFKVVDSKYKEVLRKHLSHQQQVKFLALGKAKAAAKKYPKAVIVAADTMVSFGGKVLGKPKTLKQAEAMLKSFSGKPQFLLTGVVVMDALNKKVIATTVKSNIYFKKLSESDTASYIASGEPYDKAGGYNLQGLGFNLIEKIEGDFTNCLGLPMGFVFNALKKLGVKI